MCCDGVTECRHLAIDQCPPLESRGGELQLTCIPSQSTQQHGLAMAPIFQTRQERLDWQLIAELEPLVLVSGSPEEIGNDDLLLTVTDQCYPREAAGGAGRAGLL